MAITFHQDYFRNSAGVKWQIIGKFDLDASYPAGGYLIDPATIGLSQIDSVVVNDAAFGYEYNWDKANSKLLVYEGGGGGGGIFIGNPAILTGTNNPSAVTGTADPQTWTGNLLAPHAHPLAITNVSGTYLAWRVYIGAVVGGPFVVGETVSDAFANTGVVSNVGAGFLDLNAHAGAWQLGSALTGGTSGATTTSTSGLVGVVTPGTAPFILAGAQFEAGAQPMVALPNGALNPNTIPAAAIVGLTIEGSTLDWDGTPDDNYSFDYMSSNTGATSAGTPTGANLASAINGTATAQTLVMNSYTPTGTIAGGGPGAPQTEVPGGTNLSTVINVEFISFGL